MDCVGYFLHKSVILSETGIFLSLFKYSFTILFDKSLLKVDILMTRVLSLTDVLSPGNNYAIKCALTNQTGEDVGLASIDVTVFSKPISCQVSVADYTVLLEVRYTDLYTITLLVYISVVC